MRAIVRSCIVLLALGAACRSWAIEPEARPREDAGATAKPLLGVVVDERGAAIRGADVVFQSWAAGQKIEIAARSDGQGRFEILPSAPAGGASPPARTLWAGASNRRLRRQTLSGDEAPSPPGELRLALRTPANLPLTVLGPDGKPLPRAQVSPSMAMGEDGGNPRMPELPVPEALARLTQATTDGEGRAILSALAFEEIATLRVTTAEYGSQMLELWRRPAGDRPPELTINLKPVGRVRGRLVASQAELVRGTKIALTSYPTDLTRLGKETTGWATAVTDAEGRFEAPALAQGILRWIYVEYRPESGLMPVTPEQTAIAPGQTVELTIPFKPTVHVRGMVREKATGEPTVGAVLSLFRERGESYGAVRTEADGRFEFWLLPGPHNLHLISIKPHGAPGWFRQRHFHVSGGGNDLELPPIELALARGRVVDGAGRGIAGAKIEQVVSRIELEGKQVESPVRWSSGLRSLSTDANGNYQACRSGRGA